MPRSVLVLTLSLAACTALAACQHASAPSASAAVEIAPPRGGVTYTAEEPPGIWSDHFVSPSAYEHYMLARMYHEQQEPEEALVNLRLAIAFDPESAALHAWLAELLLESDDLEGAREALGVAFEKDPESPDAFRVRARLAEREEDWEGAAAASAQAVALEPGHNEAWFDRIGYLARLGRSQEALDVADALVARWPHDPRAHATRGRLQAALGQPEAAAASFEEVIELRPRSTTGFYHLADVYLSADQADEAYEVFVRCTETCFKAPGCWFKRVQLRRAQTRDPKAPDVLTEPVRMEIRGMAEALAGDPGEAASIASRLNAAEDLPLLRAFVEESARFQPGLIELRYYVGLLAQRRDLREEALAAFRAVPPESRFFMESRAKLAIKLAEHGRHKEALEALGEAITREPDLLELWSLKAALHERSGDLIGALDALEHAVVIVPDRAELHMRLAKVAWRLRRQERTVRALERALELTPQDPSCLKFLGLVLAELGVELERAETLVRQAVERAGADEGLYVGALGWVHFKMGRVPEAIAQLCRAVELQPREASLLDNLGDAYQADGQRELALASYQAALDVTRDEGLRTALRRKIRVLSARHP